MLARHRSLGLLAALSCSPLCWAQAFVDRSAELGIAPTGEHAAFGDVNQDGWPDLWASGVLWINQHGKTFTRVEAPGGGLIVDLDNDGTSELVSFSPLAVSRVVRTGETWSVAAADGWMPALPHTICRGAVAADFNRDGFLDLYTGGYEIWEPQTTLPSFVLLNEGGKALRLAATTAERRARGVTGCDFDADGDVDVYVSNYRLQPNNLMVNDGRGAFTDEATARNALATSAGFSGGHSIGACVGDFDNDGLFDLFAGNFAHVDSRGDQPKSRFLRNRGAPGGFTFDDLAECGVWYQESYASPACADFDNDGRLDLFFTTVYADASFGKKNFPVLFRSDSIAREAWSFTDATEGSGLEKLPPTYQAAWADVDRDGRVDLVTAGKLFMNNGPKDAHWLAVRLVGDGKAVNREAIGAVVKVIAGDRMFVRQIESGTGEGNANALLLHFGLGASDAPVDILIRWPDGMEQSLSAQAVDRVIDVTRARIDDDPPAAMPR